MGIICFEFFPFHFSGFLGHLLLVSSRCSSSPFLLFHFISQSLFHTTAHPVSSFALSSLHSHYRASSFRLHFSVSHVRPEGGVVALPAIYSDYSVSGRGPSIVFLLYVALQRWSHGRQWRVVVDLGLVQLLG